MAQCLTLKQKSQGMKKILCMTMLMLAALTASATAQAKAASPPLSRTSPHQRQRSASGLSPTDGPAASPNVRPRMRRHPRRAAQSLAHTLLRLRTRTDSEQSGLGPRTAGEPRTLNPCAPIELRQQPHRLSYPRCGC